MNSINKVLEPIYLVITLVISTMTFGSTASICWNIQSQFGVQVILFIFMCISSGLLMIAFSFLINRMLMGYLTEFFERRRFLILSLILKAITITLAIISLVVTFSTNYMGYYIFALIILIVNFVLGVFIVIKNSLPVNKRSEKPPTATHFAPTNERINIGNL